MVGDNPAQRALADLIQGWLTSLIRCCMARAIHGAKLTLYSLIMAKQPPLGLPEAAAAGAGEVRRSLIELALKRLL